VHLVLASHVSHHPPTAEIYTLSLHDALPISEINSQGGYVKQYQVLVNPDRMSHYGITLQQVYQGLARNNANSGGGILPHYAEQRSEEHTSELQSRENLVCRLLLEKKKQTSTC